MRADADLLAGDVDAVVPALVEHRLAERLRTVRVGALADGEVGGLLVEIHVMVEGRDAGFALGGNAAAVGAPPAAGDRGAGAEGRKTFDDGGHVLRRRTAASAHQAQAEFAHELLVRGGEFGG